jgi:peroxiredoxin
MRKNATVSTVSNILKQDPVLANNEIRMLFLVKLLNEYTFPVNAMTKLLKELQTEYPAQIRKASEIIILKNNQLSPKSAAPVFSFNSTTGKTIKSSDLKGKYLYVNFFKSNCYDCISEMEQMRSLYEKNSTFFEFVSICIDNKEDTFIEFSKKHTYPWEIVYAGYRQDVILDWKAFMLPYYVLIDNNYKIINCPASSPEEDVRFIMEKISWEEQRRQRP